MLIHHLHVISCSSHGSFASRLLLPVSTSSVKIKSVKYIFLWCQQNCFVIASSQAIRSLSVNISIHLIDLGNSGKEICYRYSENSFYLMKTLWNKSIGYCMPLYIRIHSMTVNIWMKIGKFYIFYLQLTLRFLLRENSSTN